MVHIQMLLDTNYYDKGIKKMNNYTKDEHQFEVSKVIKKATICFLLGALLGAGASALLHKCETPIEESPVITEETIPTPIPTIAPTSTPMPTPTAIATPTPTSTTMRSLGKFRLTAYCNCSKCCGKWSGGPTASGKMPQAGRTIATDPKVIPLGTKVIIDGKTYTAEDTGSAIKGKRIDIYYNSHSEALNHGVKYKEVFQFKGVRN